MSIKYESMDEGDVRFYLKDANIVQYRSLVGYTMQKILPRNKSYVIILYCVEWEPRSLGSDNQIQPHVRVLR